MNDRDRMLAEGPRVAPEPPTADGSVLKTPITPRPSPAGSQDRGLKVPRGLMRLFPIAVFGVILAANSGAGKYAIWAIAAIAVGTMLIRLARKATK